MVPNNMDALEWLRKHLDGEDSDLLREMVRTFAERLMAAEVDVCATPATARSPRSGPTAATATGPASWTRGSGRSSCRSRSCARAATTRTGCSSRAGGPSGRWWRWWRRVLRAGRLHPPGGGAGADPGDRVAVEVPGVPDGQGARRRGGGVPQPALDAGPYTYVSLDALTQKVREGGRIVNVAVVIAVGVNADGHREILGFDVITTEDGAGWLAFLRGLVARGLAGATLVISDAHPGLVDAVAPP